MRIFWTLLRRELSSFFFTWTGYVIIAAVTLIIGATFVMLVHNMGTAPFSMPVTQLFETLMTTGVGDLQVVIAKFAGAMIFYMTAWLPAVISLVIIQRFTNQPKLDPGVIGGMYLGILLSGGLFLAIGCLASAMSRSQMVAAVMSLATGMLLFILAYMAQVVPENAFTGAEVLYYFNLFKQMEDFTRGVLDTRAVVFYVSVTVWFLFLTLRVVESRRWK
jgi:ABC-2 type transport system permease protein